MCDELPDYYSEELKIEKNKSATDPLKLLAERHKEITGLPLNWYGTYNSVAQRVITRLKRNGHGQQLSYRRNSKFS